MDDQLNERARRLLAVALAEDVPPDDVVQDSWGMVISRVTTRADGPSVEQARAVLPKAAPGWVRPAIATAVVAAIGLSGWWVVRSSGRDAVAPVVTPSRAEEVSPPTSSLAPASSFATPAEMSGVPADRLLDAAEAALANAPTRALDLVDRHAVVAPATDADRRMALRIDVLCALGRKDDATAEATAFLAMPRSPASTARVRNSCGAPRGAR